MDKLTLEHLAIYLPYGVKMQVMREDGNNDIITLNASKVILVLDEYYCSTEKLILRPLSDLTKEIEHNGERFVPKNQIDQYTQVGGDGKLYLLVDGAHWSCNPLSWDYSTVLKLVSWHFDVLGLIDKGLAIDLNTLKMKNNG